MATTLARQETAEELATSMAESERIDSRLMPRSARAPRPSEPGTPRRPRSGDGVLALCLLVLVGVVIAGVLLALFSWVTATLPHHATVCPSAPGCEAPSALPQEGGLAPLTGGLWLDEPRMAP